MKPSSRSRGKVMRSFHDKDMQPKGVAFRRLFEEGRTDNIKHRDKYDADVNDMRKERLDLRHDSIKRYALPLVFAAVTTGSILSAPSALAASTSKKITYKGPTVNDQWGSARAAIVVQHKKIIKVKAKATYHTQRSQFIDQNALPTLRSETLKAQSAKIQAVSGATITSDAYIASLKKAVHKAIQAKTLK